MIEIKCADNYQELNGILDLQKANLSIALRPEEMKEQGFVTVVHSYEQLATMNNVAPHIIATSEDKVIAYLLAMTDLSKHTVPILIPMFDIFDKIIYKERLVSSYHYMVVGQVCIEKAFRGIGLLDQCYDYYKNRFAATYDFAITEIAATNYRSLQAHSRIGFREVERYIAPDSVEWIVVIWDWKTSS